jgi:hypothetical protein
MLPNSRMHPTGSPRCARTSPACAARGSTAASLEHRTANAVNGLDIARDFFVSWGLPALERGFPSLVGRVAVERFNGSDVIGADDEISRDHNWGPQFCLFLSEDDFVGSAERLSKRMNELAPSDWKGYRVAGAGDKCVVVESVPRWFYQNIGFCRPP